MSQIVVPTILSEKEVNSMRPQDRERYVETVILEVLRRNPRGATVSEIAKATPFYRTTIAKHLEKVVATRQATQIVRGNVSVYYRNGNVARAMELRDKTNPAHFYTISKLVNEEGTFVYVQEKEVDEQRNVRVRGGIMIPIDTAPAFIAKIQTLGLEGGKNE